MADLDEEFARFAAELKSVEQAVAAETAADDDAAAAPPPLAPPPVLPPPVAQVRCTSNLIYRVTYHACSNGKVKCAY
jgi:hypothetical protein